MDQDLPAAPPGPPRPCPHCGKPAVARHRPFCSARCANIDLGRWLNGDYRIAAEESEEDAPDDSDEG
ncbi:MAG: DNA gyrase inhibitor YacG [Stellaceae bacterium]